MNEWIVTFQRRNTRQTDVCLTFNDEEAARTQYDYAITMADNVRLSKVKEFTL